MRVVIVGAGEVGFNTALMLSGEGHDVVLIEQNEALVERATGQLDALAIQGNGASPREIALAVAAPVVLTVLLAPLTLRLYRRQ